MPTKLKKKSPIDPLNWEGWSVDAGQTALRKFPVQTTPPRRAHRSVLQQQPGDEAKRLNWDLLECGRRRTNDKFPDLQTTPPRRAHREACPSAAR